MPIPDINEMLEVAQLHDQELGGETLEVSNLPEISTQKTNWFKERIEEWRNLILGITTEFQLHPIKSGSKVVACTLITVEMTGAVIHHNPDAFKEGLALLLIGQVVRGIHDSFAAYPPSNHH